MIAAWSRTSSFFSRLRSTALAAPDLASSSSSRPCQLATPALMETPAPTKRTRSPRWRALGEGFHGVTTTCPEFVGVVRVGVRRACVTRLEPGPLGGRVRLGAPADQDDIDVATPGGVLQARHDRAVQRSLVRARTSMARARHVDRQTSPRSLTPTGPSRAVSTNSTRPLAYQSSSASTLPISPSHTSGPCPSASPTAASARPACRD